MGDREFASGGIDQTRGMCVGVGIHADDGVDRFCEHDHCGCSLQGVDEVGAGLGGDT